MANTTIGALTGTAGGTNVPLGDMSASAVEPVVVIRPAGVGTPYQTLPVSSLPGGQTEFDHILTSRADLVAVVAPVGGVFILPAGSYFVKTSFALNANEGLRVDNTNVFIQGGGAGKTITGGSNTIPLLRVQGAAGQCQLLAVGLVAAVADVILLDADGDVTVASQCLFSQTIASATNPIVRATGNGRLTLDSCRLTANGRVLRHSSGQRMTVSSSRLESSANTVVEVDTANAWLLVDSSIVRTTGGTGQAFFVNAATANVFVTDCEVAVSNATGTCALISTNGVAAFSVRGGEWQTGSGAGSTGIQINGPISKGFAVDGVFVQNCATWVLHSSGTVASADVRRCVGTTNVTTCVNWNVANIPTRGLCEHANHWNATSANTFTNHQQNDARVMRRSNVSSAGNMSETGIAP